MEILEANTFFSNAGRFSLTKYVYKFQCGVCNEFQYDESIKILYIRSGGHISVSPLIGKKVYHQITLPFVIIYFTQIFDPLLKT